MQIKLYSENDTRPVGSYEFACSAYVSPFSILFVSQTGVQILSSLRHKITLDPGDDLKHNIMGQTYEITGVSKKEYDRLVEEMRQEKLNVTKSKRTSKSTKSTEDRTGNNRGIADAGPNEVACNDSDEKFIPRPLGKTRRQRNNGKTSGVLPFDSDGID